MEKLGVLKKSKKTNHKLAGRQVGGKKNNKRIATIPKVIGTNSLKYTKKSELK